MKYPTYKRALIIVAGGSLLLLSYFAHMVFAQSAPSGSMAVGASLQGYASCITGLGSGTAGVNVNPDGSIQGMAGSNYNLNISCSPTDPVLCAQTEAAGATAEETIQNAGGPEGVTPSTNITDQLPNTVTVQWTTDEPPIAGVYGMGIETTNADGTKDCTITLYADSQAPDLPAKEFGDLISHELGHCMGLGHSTDPNSLMTPSGFASTSLMTSDDVATLTALQNGENIPVSQCLPSLSCGGDGSASNQINQGFVYNSDAGTYSCQNCPAGQVATNEVEFQGRANVNICKACPTGEQALYTGPNQGFICGSCPADQGLKVVDTVTAAGDVAQACGSACSMASSTIDPTTGNPVVVTGPISIDGNSCVDACPEGQAPNANGQCKCAIPGQVWNPLTQQCSDACPPGESATNGLCSTSGSNASTTCTTNNEGVLTCTDGNGNSCLCKTSGQVSCTDAEGNDIDDIGLCQGGCPAGQMVQANGSCIVNCSVSPNDPSCTGANSCTINPASAACAAYCADNPTDPSCPNSAACSTDPNSQACIAYCAQNPNTATCQNTSSACTTNPTSAACTAYCTDNPTDPVCPSSLACNQDPSSAACAAFCATNPSDSSCPAPNSNACTTNPNSAACVAYCTDNPTDPVCQNSGSGSGACTQDPNSAACTAFCATNPSNPSCPSNEFCAENPTSQNCTDFCAENPDDPSCISGGEVDCSITPDAPDCQALSGDGGGGGGGGGGDDGGCVDDLCDFL